MIANHVQTDPKVECVLVVGVHRTPQIQGYRIAKNQKSNHLAIVRKYSLDDVVQPLTNGFEYGR